MDSQLQSQPGVPWPVSATYASSTPRGTVFGSGVTSSLPFEFRSDPFKALHVLILASWQQKMQQLPPPSFHVPAPRTACTSNLLFDTKRNDGAVGALYQVKIRCTWYQMVAWLLKLAILAKALRLQLPLPLALLQVLETFLILDLICTVPMMAPELQYACLDEVDSESQCRCKQLACALSLSLPLSLSLYLVLVLTICAAVAFTEVIMYYFIANRCADNLEVEQQFAPVDDSSDSSDTRPKGTACRLQV